MTGPGDENAAAYGRSRGRMRASHADREQVVEVLKTAFAEGRLDKHELDTRLGRALASRTYAELAALTADIPAEPAWRQPAGVQNRASRRHPVRNGAIGVGVSLIVAVAAVLGAAVLNNNASRSLVGLTVLIVFVAVPLIVVCTVATALDERRSRRQLPPRPGHGDQVLGGQHDGAAGRDPARPGARPDNTRANPAELRNSQSCQWQVVIWPPVIVTPAAGV